MTGFESMDGFLTALDLHGGGERLVTSVSREKSGLEWVINIVAVGGLIVPLPKPIYNDFPNLQRHV